MFWQFFYNKFLTFSITLEEMLKLISGKPKTMSISPCSSAAVAVTVANQIFRKYYKYFKTNQIYEE